MGSSGALRRLALAGLFLAAAAALAYLLWRWARPAGVTGPWSALALAAAAYLAAHALRGLRLFLLLNDGRLRLGAVLAAHVHAAGVSRLVPWKLGEAYRVAVLTGVCGDPLRAVAAVWIERLYDLPLVLGLFGLCALAAGAWPSGLAPLLIVAAVFVLLSSLVFLVLPENLGLVARYLALRHNRPWVLRALDAIARVRRVLRTATAVWRHRQATVLWLGTAIWALEAAAIAAAAGGWDPRILAALLRGAVVEDRVWEPPAPEAALLRVATVDLLAAGALALTPALAAGLRSRRRA
jgi:hypothetical protein